MKQKRWIELDSKERLALINLVLRKIKAKGRQDLLPMIDKYRLLFRNEMLMKEIEDLKNVK